MVDFAKLGCQGKAERGCKLCAELLASGRWSEYRNHHPSSIFPALNAVEYNPFTKRSKSIKMEYCIEPSQCSPDRLVLRFYHNGIPSHWAYYLDDLLANERHGLHNEDGSSRMFFVQGGGTWDISYSVSAVAMFRIAEHFTQYRDALIGEPVPA